MILALLFALSIQHVALAQDTLDIKALSELSFEELMNVETISATKTSQRISEAPAIISVVTARQIKEHGYQTIGEALQSVAGLDLSHDYLQYNLGVRGINGGMRAWSRIVKVMIDGQPVSYRPSSENFLGEELVPINVVERIEIIRGPGSALYGANAFLGVVNIITMNGEDVQGGKVTAYYENASNLKAYGTSVVIGGKYETTDIIVAGTFRRSDRSGLVPVNVPDATIYGGDDKSDNDIGRPRSLFAKLQYEKETLGSISLDFNYQLLDKYGEFQDWGTLTHNNRVALGNLYARGKYVKELSEKLTGTFSAAYAKGEPTDNERLDTDTNTSDWITRDVGYEGYDAAAAFMYDFDKHNSFTVGFDFTSDKQNLQTHYLNRVGTQSLPMQGIVHGHSTFENAGLYLQTIVYPSFLSPKDRPETFGLTVGLRYDKHNIYENVVNYRVGAVYQISDDVYTKLLYGTSFKAPSSVQLSTNYIATGGVIGNPDLEPEKARTIEAAIGANLSEHINLKMNAFYNTVGSKVELLLPSGAVSNVTPDNVADITSAGVESELTYLWQNLRGHVNFSYQKSIIEKEHLIRGMVRLNTALYPPVRVWFGANYRIPQQHLNLSLEGKYTGSRIASQPNSFAYDPVNYRVQGYELDPYFVLNLTLSYYLTIFKDKETEVKAKICNVFGETYAYPGFRDYDIPGSARTLSISLTQQF